jgi:hypothetical protein
MRYLALLTLFACTTEKEDDTEAPPVEQEEDSPTVCEGAAPTLTELVVEEHDELVDFEGTLSPALKVAATGKDDDGDLHRMNMTLWWDDVVDGTVDTSGAGSEIGYYAMDEDRCGTFEATYGVLFEVEGNRFDYETAYEFAAQVYDDAGLVSEIFIASGTTPAAAE